MNYAVVLYDKTIQVEISQQAEKALTKLKQPIIADINLIFGCMIAKRVWFKEQVDSEVVAVTDKLGISFRVVRYEVCNFANIDGGVEPEEFPLAKEKKHYVPDNLFIDYKKNKFIGKYSLQHSIKDNE
jgi:hypothetical protein